MNLLEYEAKGILDDFQIPVPRSEIITTADQKVFLPCVIKSQVPVGGRGKAGGIQIANSPIELTQAIRTVKSTKIKGFLPEKILAEELINIDRELYVSLLVDRSTHSIQLIAHANGGVEIETLPEQSFFKRPLTHGTLDAVGQELADYFELADKSFALTDLLEKLYRCFTKSDALLLEINPLVVTTEGAFVAGDCKMTLDSAAAFRHKEWNFTEKPASANFVTLDADGNIATIANGAGLAMATVDAVKDAGLTPANFLDIGGNATTEGIIESFNQLVKFNNLTNIVINIFGGIVRCDTVARAIIEARRAIPSLPPLQIRLSGTNSVEARALLEKEGLVLHDTLESCLTEITR